MLRLVDEKTDEELDALCLRLARLDAFVYSGTVDGLGLIEVLDRARVVIRGTVRGPAIPSRWCS